MCVSGNISDSRPGSKADAVETGFNAYLAQTISIRDISVLLAKKENFYQYSLVWA